MTTRKFQIYFLSHLRRWWSFLKRFGPEARLRRAIAHQFLQGEGIEIGALHNPLPTTARVKYVDRLSGVELRSHYPELIAFPLAEPDILDDGESLTTIPDGSLDFIIANHFIEHCEDPIRTLKTFHSKLRDGGTIYLAVPDKRYTFDNPRPSTTFDHLIADHSDGGHASRWNHYLEFAALGIKNFSSHQEALAIRAQTLMLEKYKIHFHVWSFFEFSDALKKITLEFMPSLSVTRCAPNGKEGIFILKKHLTSTTTYNSQ